MKSLLIVLTFLTRLPIKYPYEFSKELYIKGIKYFPLVGLVIGGLLYSGALFEPYIDRPVLSLLLLLFYLWITGGLHLDGTADTCDGIFSGRERPRMLEIMSDSRIGTFGVISLIMVLGAYLVLFSYVNLTAILVFPVVGKSSAIVSAFNNPYAKKEGMGKDFVQGCQLGQLIIAIIFPLVITLILQDHHMLMSVLICFIIVRIITAHIRNRLNGITGDTVGFIMEISQVIFLLLVYLIRFF
ncbi:MAG: adenosylcobinamide-GDP ribazoletransferase [Clostridia bacterium]|nr:adenosylcobinamide-GDP ribazoletransferase [Clostridia bacterium]